MAMGIGHYAWDREGDFHKQVEAAGEWLDGAFNAGDLLMVQVLRRLRGSNILDDYRNLYSLCRPRRSAAGL